MRWATIAVELALLTMMWAFPALDLPIDHILWLVIADAVANAVNAWWLSSRGEVPPAAAILALTVQVVLITALLELTGGPSNPFVVVYVLQIALTLLTFGPFAAGLIGAVAVGSYAVLIYWHVHELVPTHHRLNDFPTHLFTIWLAGTVTAELVAYFVGRASQALLQRESALEVMRARAARSERLVSLTTLAAGTAHELSTPLATIALTARELERALVAKTADPELTDDARLIRAEVDRCQAILDQMSGRAGGATADEPEVVPLGELLEDVRRQLPPDRANQLVVKATNDLPTVFVPRAGLRQTLLSLIANALDASANTGSPVLVTVAGEPELFRISVSDEGPGLTPEVARRAGEPFFTTKDAGRGLGLGLFLARVFAERLGGSLKLESSTGTTAILELPTNIHSLQVL
jgi:two-component system sensor histidine kinase RegB